MSPLVLQIISYAVPLVVGYLLRHFNISIPGLPAPAPVPVSSPSPHVSLLQQLLGLGKQEAEDLLKRAVQQVALKGLTDATTGSTPKAG
jgi:hypothetical protein